MILFNRGAIIIAALGAAFGAAAQPYSVKYATSSHNPSGPLKSGNRKGLRARRKKQRNAKKRSRA